MFYIMITQQYCVGKIQYFIYLQQKRFLASPFTLRWSDITELSHQSENSKPSYECRSSKVLFLVGMYFIKAYISLMWKTTKLTHELMCNVIGHASTRIRYGRCCGLFSDINCTSDFLFISSTSAVLFPKNYFQVSYEHIANFA